MLQIPRLDDEGFAEIMEQARGMIAQYSATWTDFNHHDPGITLLELFAFLKEAQQFHLDQIGPQNRQKFLKLLGKSPATPKGAKVWCNLRGTQQILPRGTELTAGVVPFALAHTTEVSQVEIVGGTVEGSGQITTFQMPLQGQRLHLMPFGEGATAGDYFSLSLNQPPKTQFHIYFRLQSEQVAPRNPLRADHGFTPLVNLSWNHATPDGWAPLTVVSDGTAGLLFDGQVMFQSTAQWAKNPVICCALTEGVYDVPPVVVGMSTQMAEAVQERVCACMETVTTLERNGKYWLECDHVLCHKGYVEAYYLGEDDDYYLAKLSKPQYDGAMVSFSVEQAGDYVLCSCQTDFQLDRVVAIGTGFPNQTYDLPAKGLVAEEFGILVQAVESHGFARWQQVEDFDSSTPEDTHFILDCQQGTITFGDCHHGLAPEGEIRLVAPDLMLPCCPKV